MLGWTVVADTLPKQTIRLSESIFAMVGDVERSPTDIDARTLNNA
jgi:hypothetical protein